MYLYSKWLSCTTILWEKYPNVRWSITKLHWWTSFLQYLVWLKHNFSLSNNPKHFVNKQQVTHIHFKSFHIAVSELRYAANPQRENPPSKVKQWMESIFFKPITADSVHRFKLRSWPFITLWFVVPPTSRDSFAIQSSKTENNFTQYNKHYVMLNQFWGKYLRMV